MLHSVGSGYILLPVPCGQDQCVVCQRLRRVHLLLLRWLWVWCFLGILGAPWSLVYMVGASFASVHPHVYRTRITKVCLSLDMPIGRTSVVALSASSSGS